MRYSLTGHVVLTHLLTHFSLTHSLTEVAHAEVGHPAAAVHRAVTVKVDAWCKWTAGVRRRLLYTAHVLCSEHTLQCTCMGAHAVHMLRQPRRAHPRRAPRPLQSGPHAPSRRAAATRPRRAVCRACRLPPRRPLPWPAARSWGHGLDCLDCRPAQWRSASESWSSAATAALVAPPSPRAGLAAAPCCAAGPVGKVERRSGRWLASWLERWLERLSSC